MKTEHGQGAPGTREAVGPGAAPGADWSRRIYGGWLGKAIGVAYGAPVEGWTFEQIRATYGDLVAETDRFYLTPMEKLFGADDDTSHPLLMLAGVADALRAGATTVPAARELGRWWLNLMPEDHGVIWRGGYGVSTEDTAFQNLLAGIEAPASGSTALNGPVVSQQIGGQIFSDLWGWLAPGDPERAAAWAEASASVSHDGDGRLGARFVAAMVSLAFCRPTIEAVVREALDLLPPEATYTRVMEDVYRFWQAHPDDWEGAFAHIAAHHGYDRYPGVCHIIPNAAVVTMSLLYGGGDFDRTVRIANAAGWDTDCNVGNAGAVVGTLVGPEGIPAAWREPLRDLVMGSGVLGARNLLSLAGVARLTAAAARRLRGVGLGRDGGPGSGVGARAAEEAGALAQDPVLAATHRATFDGPGATEGFRPDRDLDQALEAVRQVQGVAAAGDGSLQLVIQRLDLLRPARLVREVLPAPAELSRPGYDPAFSPSLYPGGVLTAHILLPGEGSPSRPAEAASGAGAPSANQGGDGAAEAGPEAGLLAGFFVDVMEPGEGAPRRRLYQERFTPLTPGRWVPVRWAIPEAQGMVVRFGLELRAGHREVTYTGPIYVDEIAWAPDGRFELRFEGWPHWYGAAAGWTYTKGLWQVEDGLYVGRGPDHGESFTGSPEWAESTVDAELIPQWGPWHLVLVRVQGARRWYGAALAPGGRLAIVRHRDDGLEELASTPFPWELGQRYRLRVRAAGPELTVWAEALDGDRAAASAAGAPSAGEGRVPAHGPPPPVQLTWTEMDPNAWSRGCVGLGVRQGSRLACRAIRVEAKA